MELDFDALFKAVDMVAIIAVIAVSFLLSSVLKEYERYLPLIPLILGTFAGIVLTPAGAEWRIIAKAALFYAGAASLVYKIGRTTFMGKGLPENGKLQIKGLILILAFSFLQGCAGIIHELKTDSTVIGTTGLWISIGVEGMAGGIPLPQFKMGYGTVWRVGPHNKVEVVVNSRGGGGVSPSADGRPLLGEADLIIKADGTRDALEPMKDLYGK